MKQEDKELLLRDLCTRLPYRVKCKVSYNSNVINDADVTLYGMDNDGFLTFDEIIGDHREFLCKPYLFPLSSMTEEQTEEVHNLIYQGVSESVDETKEWLKTRKENELRPITLTYILSYRLVIDFFNKNHFDYRGLIPKGLAIDATNLNIY